MLWIKRTVGITLFSVLFFPYFSYSETFLVTNTHSSGSGSLSDAIIQSQNHPGADTIVFRLTLTDQNFNGTYWQINLDDPLPVIDDDSTCIDGSSQSVLYETNPIGPEIEINGSNCPSGTSGLEIRSSYNIIKGLAIGGFPKTGISIQGDDANYNKVSGCFVGVSADGTSALSNQLNGIECTYGASYNIIGGTSANHRNVISGNKRYGVRIELASHNSVVGNYIGVDYTGLVALPNGAEPKKWAGVYVATSSKHNHIGDGTPEGRNVISGNHRTGIRIEWSGADSNYVQGNYIGVGADGETKIPNGEAGLVIGRGASFNLIGGDKPEEANVISGNHSSGIQFARASYKNVLKGNLIGTDATGEKVVPNDHNGIYFYGNDDEGYPLYNIIGPNNVICGNGVSPYSQWWAGISIDYPGTAHNQCYGNYIGRNASGSLIDGQPTGVLIQRGAHDNIIGPNNIIAYSDFNGVHVMHDSTVNNKITQNLIFANQGLAIADVDGGNHEIQPPAIEKVEKTGVEGRAIPYATVELYASPDGQADAFLGSTTADVDGSFSWSGDLPETNIAALEIDTLGNTSELAVGVAVPVELSSFTARLQADGVVHLLWRTDSETNNFGFYLQRRCGKGVYSNIRFVAGRGTTTQETTYEVIDTLQYHGTYNYRLKQVDQDGSFQYSQPIRINYLSKMADLTLSSYPNPFNSQTQITFTLSQMELVSLTIYDILGNKVRTLFTGELESGDHTMNWNGRDESGRQVASGEYFVFLTARGERIFKKVLLLK